jgi:homocysteine S-methyltransferase
VRIPIKERLQAGRPFLIDGATGTELSRRGVDLNTPSWTAGVILDQPDLLQQVHADYVAAGAELITANTFRTHARNLRSLNSPASAAKLTRRAVEIARLAAGDGRYVAGSIAPLEDCYSPHLTPSEAELRREHSEMARHLADSGVDLILIETQVTIREACIAAEAASETGLPFAVSFVCREPRVLLSGESLEEAFDRVLEWHPAAFLVNCTPVDEILPSLEPLLKRATDIPFGAYANTGRLLANGSWEATEGRFPAVYAEFVQRWISAGVKVIGGCCGTTPEHISAIRALI